MGIKAPYPPSPYPPKGPYEVTLLQPSLNSEHRVLELRLPFIFGGLSESKMSGHGLSLTKSFWEAGHYCAFEFHLGGGCLVGVWGSSRCPYLESMQHLIAVISSLIKIEEKVKGGLGLM